MKKVITFILNCIFGRQSQAEPIVWYVIIPSLVLGLLTSVPELWMGDSAYEASLLSVVSPYLWIPFGVYVLLFLFIGAPFLYYAGTINPKMKGTKWIGVLVGLPAGVFCIGLPITHVLEIPSGPWNLGIMIVASILYLSIVKIIFKKSFADYYPGSDLAV